jgi:PAS domain S-box-containing protein
MPPLSSESRSSSAASSGIDTGLQLPSSELLRALAEVSQVPLLITRQRDGEILYCNDRLARLVGLPATQIVGRQSLDFYYDPADRDALLAEVREKGSVRGREVRLKTPSGSIAWVSFTIEPLQCSGDPLLLGALYDVTAQKEIEARLRESEARLQGYVENTNDLVFALDEQSRLTYVSPNAVRILGYSPAQLLGQNFDALVHSGDLPKLWECSEELQAGGEAQHQSEFRIQHKDGSTRWFCSTMAPSEGNPGLTGTAHDITGEKLALQALEQANRSLRDAQLQLLKTEKMASLGMLMAGIAHEIRTPLGAVSSTQQTVAQALDKLGQRLSEAHPEVLSDSKVGRLLKVLTDSARVVGDGSARVMDIVQRLRKYSCADEAKLCSVDVNAIADDTLALVNHELKHHVAIQKCFGEGVTLVGYPARLNQVLVNLLVNAAHAVRARGRGKVTLATRAIGEQIEITVSDDGIGIPPENLELIFTSGFTTKHSEGGSGLGLAISKAIVNAHDGSLTVSSQVGLGTTFTVRLPRTLPERLRGGRCPFG